MKEIIIIIIIKFVILHKNSNLQTSKSTKGMSILSDGIRNEEW